MSILQIEISDETRKMLEEQAKREQRDTQDWSRELMEEAVRARQQKQQEEKRFIEQKLLEALESGPGQVADQAWWQRLEADVMDDLKKRETP